MPTPAIDDERRCVATAKSTGERCGRWAIAGGTVCVKHGGRAGQVRAAADRRLAEAQAVKALQTYGLPVTVNPVEALQDELNRTAGHVAWLGLIVADLRPERLTRNTGAVWIELYQKERAHLARVAADAIKAGLAERQVRLAEEQGHIVADLIRRIVSGLGLDPSLPEVREVVHRELLLLDGGRD